MRGIYWNAALLVLLGLGISRPLAAQDMQGLLSRVRARIAQVNEYAADAHLKIDVSFMKVPESAVRVFFRKPDHFRIRKEGGISILPKGGLNVSLNSLLQEGNFTAVDAGTVTVQGSGPLRVVKLLPVKEESDIVLTTLYIEEKTELVRKAVTTTRDNGTFELDLDYGKYAAYALPDRAVFIFSTEGYKLPKGLALEYDPHGKAASAPPPPGESKGEVILTYLDYTINKGLPADAFQ